MEFPVNTLQICILVFMMTASFRTVASLSLPVAEDGRACGGDYKLFYDDGTESCERCSEICEHAEIKGTVEQCQVSCPKYLQILECEKNKDNYYDEMVEACSQCAPICDNHMLTRTTSLCQEKCNDYMARLTPKQVPSMHKQNSLVAIGDQADGDSSNSDASGSWLQLHPGWIAAIAMGGFAIVVSVLVVAVLFKVCKSPLYAPAQTDDAVHPQGRLNGQLPIAETTVYCDSTGAALLPHASIGNGHATGFSDLGNDGSRTESSNGHCLCVL